MSAVVVHRCVVRIRRTAGWAWGASAEALVQAATRALPDLIAAHLPELVASTESPVHITRPIQVKLETTVAELVALANTNGDERGTLAERISRDVARAVEQAIARDEGEPGVAPDPERRGDREEPTSPTAVDLDPQDAQAQRRAIRAWWRSGAIETVIGRMPPTTVARLHALVLPPPTSTDDPRAELLAIAEAIATRFPLARTTADERARLRIVIAAALVDAFPSVSDRAVTAAVDRVLPLAPAAEPSPVAEREGTVATVPASAPRPSPANRTLEIRSVLPFLLLPSLHHARWLDSATTLLAAHEIEQLAFALAAGLAAKVLDPPARGWSRTSADRAVIAAFAGTDEEIADAGLASAASRIAPILDALDASLRAVLVRARRPRPLVLARDEQAWILLDGSGMTVLGRHRELAVAIASGCAAPILVPAALADPSTLDALDLANHRFITNARPTRGEAWRRVRGVTHSFATNDTETSAAQLVALTADFDQTTELASELVEVIGPRLVLPCDPLVRLDATCALAATAALADLAARLFPTEPTTPVLVLTRFRDLDAIVTFDPDRIRVRIPLGRRHADLMRHGVLGELGRIPWLGGRTLDLGGA